MKVKKTLFLVSLFVLCIALSTLNVIAEDNGAGDLVINDLEINVDYEPTKAYNVNNLKDSQTGLVNGSTTETDIYPGSSVEFVFEIENTFESVGDDADDVVIDDVFVRMVIESIGEDEEDIDKESQTIELEPEEEMDFYVNFEMPQKVNAGTYDVKIEVEGDGTDDIRYTIDWDLKLELKKPFQS